MLEFDDTCARKVLLELVNVFNACATPTIDGLVVITHNKRYAVTASQQPEPGVLNGVGVLEFVDEQMLEASPVVP